ncbi:MAG TPA: tetratricopeptide repeat protein [Thermoanaerobaculia bacterium]|nr:tetratricopeptide repeat protein [Thermoanaerobaculia bacterium]
MRRNLALSLVLLLAAAGNAFAGAEARVSGKILDAATKQPVANATMKVEAVEGKTVKLDAKVKNDGSFALFLLDATIKYKYTVSAPGYDTFEEVIKLKIGENSTRDFTLYKAGKSPGAAPAAGAVAPAAAPKAADPAVTAYNEGAALANAQNYDAAIKKFEEAVAAKPNLTAGWIALAKTQLRQKNYAKAVEAANKVLDVDDTDNDMLTILVEGYTKLGDKANASKAQAKLPKNASAIFNDAAKLINSGDDAAAEKLLKQAVDADGNFAPAHFQLGMIYVRTGKTAEAKAALQRYLTLDPNGSDAGTAKEMMGYLK